MWTFTFRNCYFVSMIFSHRRDFMKSICKGLFYLVFFLGIIFGFASCSKSSFVLVEGTSFRGQIADSEIFVDGRPIKINSFFICNHEVTQDEYKKVMAENPSYFASNAAVNEEQKQRPVECVSFYDAIAYCNKLSMMEGLNPCYKINGSYKPADWGLIPNMYNETWNSVTCDFSANGYRLPTEVEWEYAARGGKKFIGDGTRQYLYAGGNDVGEVAWYVENSDGKTHEVLEKDSNQLDIYDMSGNVAEWCWDWFSEITAETPVTGATSSSSKTSRGGNWGERAFSNQVNSRSNENPAFKSYGLGFRVVRTAK